MALVALLPIVWLAVALAGLKWPAHRACGTALILALALALIGWQFDAACAATAVLEGFLNALWPICLVIIAALYAYNVTVHTKAMEAIKAMLGSVSNDMRVLALLIGWGFGNFMEGMAGFGTAVAIPASMLAGLGMNPVVAVVGCLVVNTTPTAFGSVGVPTATLISVTGVETAAVTWDISLIQCVLVALSPFFLVCICGGGLKALQGMIPITLVASVSYTIPWFFAANVFPLELPDIVGAVCSMLCMVLFARYQEKHRGLTPAALPKDMPMGALRAWCPYLFILILLMGTSTLVPPVHNLIAPIKTSICVYAGANGNTLTFSWINAAGVQIFIATIIGGLIQGATLAELGQVFIQTLKKYWKTVLTICCVMSMAKVMSYSGMVSEIALVLVALAGGAYPAIAPVIGALGGFVTGSGTSTSVLFGGLQVQTAASLGLSAPWMAAANIFGAGIGKMICPQSIAIGAGAAGIVGQESEILRAALKYFVIYLALAAVISFCGSALGLGL